jgi:hypothetical protein
MLLGTGSILTATQIQRLRAFANTVGVPDRYTVLA